MNRGIEKIRYFFLNLPSEISFTEKNAYIRNMYDANGHKFKMITYANIPLVIGRAAPAKVSARAKAVLPEHVTDSLLRDNSIMERLTPIYELIGVPGMTTYNYCGNIVYRNGIPTIYREDGFTTLARMRFPEFHYYIRDHQGNIRGVTDGRGNIEQQNDYYPFGGMMASSTGGAVQPYRYTGKELTRFNALNWYNYGARWYDPTTLRWNGMDRMAEKYTGSSPFIYCINDPVNRIDLDGNDWIMAKYGDYLWVYYDSNIHSQMDIYRDYYGGNPPDECDIQYIGEEGVVYNWDGDEKNAAYKLISNGTFVDNEGNIYADEVFINDSYGKLTLATDVGKIFEKDKGKNWYGSYLGPNNPQIKLGNKTKDYYGIPPINQLDFSAYIHDRGYDTMNAVGPAGVAFNFDVAKYDLLLAHMAAKDAVTTNDRKRSFVGIATSLLFHKIGLTKLIMNKIIQ